MNAVALSPRQSFLHFGAEDHIDLLHGGHKDRICIATKNGEEWNQQLHKRENASSIAFELSGDSYQEKSISILNEKKGYLFSIIKDFLFSHRNWVMGAH
jgi:hypothetical protein